MSHEQGSEFEQVVELVFQNVQYLLTVSLAPADTLCVEAEHKTDGSRWRGDFTARYIEDITQKTGNFKKFSVFVKMLRSAILQESDSVFVDLLTYQDVEMLKNRKVRDTGSQAFRSATNNKRYLILTYTGEFDRVHYPLPLMHEDNPEPEALKRTIRRLRDELEDVKGTLQKKLLDETKQKFVDDEGSIRTNAIESAELRKLKTENSRLTSQLSYMEDSCREFGINSFVNHREPDEDRKRLQRELALTQKKCELLFSRIDAKKDMKKETELLRAKLDQLQDGFRSERSAHRKAVARLARDNATLTQEVKLLRKAEKRLTLKVRESEGELDLLRRRLRVQGARDLPPFRTRPREAISLPTNRLTSGLSNNQRPSPSSTHTNTPTRSQQTHGSRPSSCPSFGSNSRNQCNQISQRGRSPREMRQNGVNSQPSSARAIDPYAREIFKSTARARPVLGRLPHIQQEQMNLLSKVVSPLETSKTGRRKVIRENQSGTKDNNRFSPEKSWLQPLHGLFNSKGGFLETTPNGLTSDDEPEPAMCHNGSRTSSPSQVLRDVKAKLHRYATLEGIEMSDTESCGTNGSLTYSKGDSFPTCKLGQGFRMRRKRTMKLWTSIPDCMHFKTSSKVQSLRDKIIQHFTHKLRQLDNVILCQVHHQIFRYVDFEIYQEVNEMYFGAILSLICTIA